MQQITQTVIPVLAAHATSTGDYEPLNGFMSKLGESMETDLSKFAIPSRQPSEPDPIQQEMQQATLAELQAKIDKLTAEAESIRMNADPSIKMAESEHQMNLKQSELSNKMALSEYQMGLKHAELGSKMDAANEALEMKAEANRQALELKGQAAMLDLANKSEQHRLKAEAADTKTLQSLDHADDTHQQALDHADDRAEQNLRAAQTNAFMKMINQGEMSAIRQANRDNPQLG
jgi:hypothetical protein